MKHITGVKAFALHPVEPGSMFADTTWGWSSAKSQESPPEYYSVYPKNQRKNIIFWRGWDNAEGLSVCLACVRPQLEPCHWPPFLPRFAGPHSAATLALHNDPFFTPLQSGWVLMRVAGTRAFGALLQRGPQISLDLKFSGITGI